MMKKILILLAIFAALWLSTSAANAATCVNSGHTLEAARNFDQAVEFFSALENPGSPVSSGRPYSSDNDKAGQLRAEARGIFRSATEQTRAGTRRDCDILIRDISKIRENLDYFDMRMAQNSDLYRSGVKKQWLEVKEAYIELQNSMAG